MDVIQVNSAGKDKLYRSLNSYTSSFVRRGVSITVQAHSDKIGSIDIQVNGKRGIGRKNIVVHYDELVEEWVGISDGYEYHMLNLSEISTLIRNKIQKLSTLLTKF
jgi:hypothetical protein